MSNRRETIDRRITILAEIHLVMDLLKPPDGDPKVNLNECASSIWAVLMKAKDEISGADLLPDTLRDVGDLRRIVAKEEDRISAAQAEAVAHSHAVFGGRI